MRSQHFTTHWPAAVLHGALPHHGQALKNSLTAAKALQKAMSCTGGLAYNKQ